MLLSTIKRRDLALHYFSVKLRYQISVISQIFVCMGLHLCKIISATYLGIICKYIRFIKISK